MATKGFVLFNCLLLFLLLNMSTLYGATEEDRKVYIVYLGSLPQGEYSLSSLHQNMLQEVVDGGSVENLMVRSYKRSFNGFAAKLTENEMQKLATKKEVVSVFPSRTLQLQTTNSWDFIGLKESVKRNPSVESDVIVGVLDSGIWPESESFSDEGFGPAPKKWKGVCKGGRNFTCNKKLIGARFYSLNELEETARDTNGHGTHTASTAAGIDAKDANFFGLGKGTARGAVPSSRIAVYKVCSEFGCSGVDILAGFDDAIADGVDLLSLSLGGDPTDFSQDPVSIGSFHAMAKGILTLNAAGNSGPDPGTTGSVAPWLMSVAATTTDRLFVDRIVLGNEKDVMGFSINGFSLNGEKFPLVVGNDVPGDCAQSDSLKCSGSCLNSSAVEGKIVLCELSEGTIAARQAGAVGSIILKDTVSGPVSFVVSWPSSSVTSKDYHRIISYINSTKNPQAEILKTESIKDSDAPVVAFFSSRGPNTILPEILKPDISAPGVNILAAYSPIASLTREDKRHAKFNIISGTSMACPHVAGVVAYVKTFHPTWSPSAIKSAIMTTARPMNDSITSQAEFAYGSGFVDPTNALNPGLVYETFEEDYIRMLCSIGYSSEKLRRLTGNNNTCLEASKKASPKDLNYPSMTSEVSAGTPFTINFHRTVTNVGLPNSTYEVHVFSNSGVRINTVPKVLSFKSLNEKKSFDVTVTSNGVAANTILSASVVWSDGKHRVRSPIALIAKEASRN
ncbi:subtilisin-like protease SBT4.13 [Mangifera indica]|uniref:subtilisin-like protease SBT4.13 n=1 Tax=Mangifera indica TaxID=29780 RepID=UPI001CFA85F4|nr:subtilisin-like protease SBT4.13 [Mangifera indica]